MPQDLSGMKDASGALSQHLHADLVPCNSFLCLLLFHMCPSLSTLHFPDVVRQCILSLLLSRNNSGPELFSLQLQGV